MTYDRPGCYEIPSHELALHFARRGKVVDATLAPAPPSGGKASQRMAVAAAAPAEGASISLPCRYHIAPLPNGLVRITQPCHWCRKTYTREIEPEFAGAVRLGGICTPCYERDEAARDMTE